MSYIYCCKITPNTQQDVNLAFRENNISAELFVGDHSAIYVTPALSWSKWKMFPQSEHPRKSICCGWEGAISDALSLMQANNWLQGTIPQAQWHQIDLSMRCPKMEAFLREQDLSMMSDRSAKP